MLYDLRDTLHVTVKCVDSNKTLDTIVFYDSIAGGTWIGFDMQPPPLVFYYLGLPQKIQNL
jgi:hypothetical protein